MTQITKKILFSSASTIRISQNANEIRRVLPVSPNRVSRCKPSCPNEMSDASRSLKVKKRKNKASMMFNAARRECLHGRRASDDNGQLISSFSNASRGLSATAQLPVRLSCEITVRRNTEADVGPTDQLPRTYSVTVANEINSRVAQ